MGMFDGIGGGGREPYIKGAIQCPRCGLNLHPSIEACPACGQNPRVPCQPQQPVPGSPANQFGQPAAPMAQNMANVPAAPSEETQYAQPGMQQQQPMMPGAPLETAAVVIGVVQHDIVVGGAVAFRQGERLQVELESPDPERPDYKYVVTSQALQKKFRLSDMDLFI
jgi:hypothetical protein